MKLNKSVRGFDVPVEIINEHGLNANEMSAGDFKKLKTSIRKNGFYPPVILNRRGEKDLVILDGHHRFKAAMELGHKTISCDVWEMPIENEFEFLNSLNNLKGTDIFEKKIALFKEMAHRLSKEDMTARLPESEQGHINDVFQAKKQVMESNQDVLDEKERLSNERLEEQNGGFLEGEVPEGYCPGPESPAEVQSYDHAGVVEFKQTLTTEEFGEVVGFLSDEYKGVDPEKTILFLIRDVRAAADRMEVEPGALLRGIPKVEVDVG